MVRASTGAMVMLTFAACAFVTIGTLSGRWTLLSVPTGSMEPTIPAGAGIVVVPTDVDDLVVGDIIVFSAPETRTPTVHRVAAIEHPEGGPAFRTKGDANSVQDPWELRIDDEHVGRVVSVSPSLGAFTELAGERIVRLGAAGLGAVMVLFAGLRAIWAKDQPTDLEPDGPGPGNAAEPTDPADPSSDTADLVGASGQDPG